ncbi:uncharacterized protein LOC119399729 [Rhipicephalus sanguineus]|uniref:uncharacterized protein LOC119399729 n=1 Tax=Rhipicephalus sanguineus TaxID=34632 RepID=UPI0018963CD3|nr:uncharacterized protein LOC119399729 [Rhipicephalus sanguineus]
MAWHVSLTWFVAATCFAAAGEPVPFETPSGVEQGERQYKAVLAKIPEYGVCWSDAVARLERGCDELTEELQGRLALAFTSCFLEKMGKPPIRCRESQPLSLCPALAEFLEKPLATSYTQFFTHTQVICAFLRSRKWQVDAARTISELGATSVRATAELRRAAETQAQLARRQQQMFDKTEHLRQELANAHSTLREHREMLDTSLLRLSYVQAFFVDQFATLHSLGYYALAAVLSFLMTTSKRTAGARPWLLMLFLVNLLIERAIVKWASQDTIDRAAPLAPDSPLGTHISLSRRLICLVALCMYLYQLYSFRDLAAVNNQLLLDLQAEMQRLRTSQSPFGSPQQPQQEQDPRTATTWRPPEGDAMRWFPLHIRPAPCLFTNRTGTDSSEESSSESEESDGGMWSLDDWDDDDDNNSNDDSHFSDESNDYFGDNVETDTKDGAGSATERDSDAASSTASAAQSGWRGWSMFGTPASPLAQEAPPSSPAPPLSPAPPTGGRYNLRPRLSLNSSSGPLSPPPLQSPSRRRDLALPRQVIEQAAILSSDED